MPRNGPRRDTANDVQVRSGCGRTLSRDAARSVAGRPPTRIRGDDGTHRPFSRFHGTDRRQRQWAYQISLGGGGSGGANSPGTSTWSADGTRTQAVFTVGEDHATGWEAGHSTLSTFALGLGAFAGLPRSPSSARRRLSAAQHMRHGSRPLKVLAAACANPRSMVRETSMPLQAATWTTVEAPVARVSTRIRIPMCRHLPRIARLELPDNSLGKW